MATTFTEHWSICALNYRKSNEKTSKKKKTPKWNHTDK